jgi:hypothetical protein
LRSGNVNKTIQVILFSGLLSVLCSGGLGQGERGEEQKEGGFYFPEWDSQSSNDYIGVFPVSRLSGYQVFGTSQPPQSLGEVSGTPFVFHSGPDYCGWIGLPGFGWFGCGAQAFTSTIGTDRSRIDRPSNEPAREIHLTKGMSKVAVMESVGSPTRKILLNGKEVWEYSGYSLLFESNSLKEIR